MWLGEDVKNARAHRVGMQRFSGDKTPVFFAMYHKKKTQRIAGYNHQNFGDYQTCTDHSSTTVGVMVKDRAHTPVFIMV